MSVIALVLLVIVLVCQSHSSVNSKDTSAEKGLIKYLLAEVDERGGHGRPVNDSVNPLEVQVNVYLKQIVNVDEHNQMLVCSVKLEYTWRDMFLTWDPKDFGNLKSANIPMKDIWQPDIIIGNLLKEEYTDNTLLFKLDYNGTLVNTIRSVIKTSCSIDMRYYPFDDQTCSITLKSAYYSSGEVSLLYTNWDPKSALNNYIESSEWIITELKMRREAFDCCGKPPEEYLTLSIQMSRSMVFFTYILLLPCFVLTLLTFVIFWLPPERPDKTTLGMAIFGSFTMLLLVLVNSMPSTSSRVPVLGLYYFFNMTFSAGSIFLSTIIVNLSKSSRTKNRPGRLLQLVFIETLAPIFGVHEDRGPRVKDIIKSKRLAKQASKLAELERKKARLTILQQKKPASEKNDEDSLKDLDQFSIKIQRNISSNSNAKQSEEGNGSIFTDMDSPSEQGGSIDTLPIGDMENKACLRVLQNMAQIMEKQSNTMNDLLRISKSRYQMEDIRDTKAYEWRVFAVTLDRLFFFVYMGCVLILVIVSAAILFPRMI